MRVSMATDPGTSGWPNEDFVAVSPGAAVLLDGATSRQRGADIGCVHGVAWYASALGATLLAAITATPPPPLPEALAGAIADVASRHRETCDLDHPATPAATVTAVRADPGGISYLALSDSTIAADYGGDREPLIITDGNRGARADPDIARHARTGMLPLRGLRGVALLSDGATRITDRYDLLSWPAVLGLISTDGPQALITAVRAAEALDPDGSRWHRRKISDDATAVWWPVTPGS